MLNPPLPSWNVTALKLLLTKVQNCDLFFNMGLTPHPLFNTALLIQLGGFPQEGELSATDCRQTGEATNCKSEGALTLSRQTGDWNV